MAFAHQKKFIFLFVALHKICQNTGKYGSKKTLMLAYFLQCQESKDKLFQ